MKSLDLSSAGIYSYKLKENGKILKIRQICFRGSLRFIKKGVGASLGIEYVQVNLSVVQCMQSDLVEQFLSIMDRYKVDPSSICLEVNGNCGGVYSAHYGENIKTLSDLWCEVCT